jgi:hypothetical protein
MGVVGAGCAVRMSDGEMEEDSRTSKLGLSCPVFGAWELSGGGFGTGAASALSEGPSPPCFGDALPVLPDVLSVAAAEVTWGGLPVREGDGSIAPART